MVNLNAAKRSIYISFCIYNQFFFLNVIKNLSFKNYIKNISKIKILKLKKKIKQEKKKI